MAVFEYSSQLVLTTERVGEKETNVAATTLLLSWGYYHYMSDFKK